MLLAGCGKSRAPIVSAAKAASARKRRGSIPVGSVTEPATTQNAAFAAKPLRQRRFRSISLLQPRSQSARLLLGCASICCENARCDRYIFRSLLKEPPCSRTPLPFALLPKAPCAGAERARRRRSSRCCARPAPAFRTTSRPHTRRWRRAPARCSRRSTRNASASRRASARRRSGLRVARVAARRSPNSTTHRCARPLPKRSGSSRRRDARRYQAPAARSSWRTPSTPSLRRG